MLISLNWIRDFVDLPADLDPKALGLRLTVTTAEVDGVHEIRVNARGLIAAKVLAAKELTSTGRKLRLVTLDVGGKTIETVSAAPSLPVGAQVVYAPPGAHVAALGDINVSTVAGHTSRGLILPGEAIGIEKAIQEAVFLGAEFKPGDALPAHLFDDWLIEIDNKSITNRPDLWGHYGIAREVAAILALDLSRGLQPARPNDPQTSCSNQPNRSDVGDIAQAKACGSGLRPYDGFLVPEAELRSASEKIPIRIADANACRRFCALRFDGVPTQPAPLWMQLRLGHVGLRPISGLVDLTNYLMCDLGQPMHAFDAGKVDAIEVDFAKDGEVFRTLDGVDRKLVRGDLMVQSRGKSIGLAGVMGGLETEVTEKTTSLLLESANFHPAVIRKTASRLGLRTDASARFEKSLDPVNPVLGIGRFVKLAREMYPKMRLTSALSDAFPGPLPPISVRVNPQHAARALGRELSGAEASKLLAPLGFVVSDRGTAWDVSVPSYRATNDISMEADVIEELARYVGYGNIAPAMPVVAMRRFAVNPLQDITRRTIEYFTTGHRFQEIHGYLWYDARWLKQVGVQPGSCLELRNPAAEGLHLLRRTLMPGMLAAAARNRFHFDAFALLEVGSVFEPDGDQYRDREGADGKVEKSKSRNVETKENMPNDPSRDREGADTRDARDAEYLHLGLVLARRAKGADEELLGRLKGAIEGWIWNRFGMQVRYERASADPTRPWMHPQRTAAVVVADQPHGTISVVDLALRRAMDEHLSAWSIAWAEIRLDDLAVLPRQTERLAGIPAFPRVEIDFSFLVPSALAYAQVVRQVTSFRHELLRQLRYVGSFTGGAVPAGSRSLTLRCVLGAERTLTDEDTGAFRAEFEKNLSTQEFSIRK